MKIIYKLLCSLIFANVLSANGASAQRVLIETTAGNIQIELYPEKAPISCKNFLEYVNAEKYNGASFYRVVRMDNQPDKKVKIEVIQGGLKDDSTKSLPPIVHETTKITDIKHVNGTLSMARNGPGTASSEFFICIGDQPELDFGGKRNPDGQGFAAFGKVVSGMNTVKAIQKQKTGSGSLSQTLDVPVNIKRMSLIK